VYLERIEEAFPSRDGRCCERVADAIAQSTMPVPGAGRQQVDRRNEPAPRTMADTPR
jgi:hypothetical protein